MKKRNTILLIGLALFAASSARANPAAAAQPRASETQSSASGDSGDATARQVQVRERGGEVMPFALDQTLHIFDRTESGGVQRVIVRDGDAEQIAMVRSHLRAIAAAFTTRDFSGPAHIHGTDMPGMAQMQAAQPGELSVTYDELPDGAQIIYVGRTPAVVDAIHVWFDAQLADHGRDATTSGDPDLPARDQR